MLAGVIGSEESKGFRVGRGGSRTFAFLVFQGLYMAFMTKNFLHFTDFAGLSSDTDGVDSL